MNDLYLKKKKAHILKRGHPWIFSGALKEGQEFPPNGSIVRILDDQGNFLAKGHYQDSSIAIRILSYLDKPIDTSFYAERLKYALGLRQKLVISDGTNAFRWIHGEGDRLGGLIMDLYGAHLVMECHSDGMYLQREEISEAARSCIPGIQTVFCKRPGLVRNEQLQKEDEFILGDAAETVILENGRKFLVNWQTGQKTGFFLDQRDNRQLLTSISNQKDVLNLFSYSGGFSIYAASAGAKKVTSVDVSKNLEDLFIKNIELNDQSKDTHEMITADVMEYLKSSADHDVIIVDPPAFAKSVKKRHNAVQAYKRLNAKVLEYVRPGGYLMTFSCSQVVEPSLFYNTIASAFIDSGKSGQIIKKLGQGMDHPVLIEHEEGSYLKGLLIRVT